MRNELSDFFRAKVGRLRIIWGASTPRGLVIARLAPGSRGEDNPTSPPPCAKSGASLGDCAA